LKTSGAEILYGIHPVAEALRAGRRSFEEILFSTGKTGPKIRRLLDEAGKRNIPVTRIPPQKLAQLAQTEIHQGIAARVSPFEPAEWPALAHRSTGPCVFLLLDSIQDPQNLGALIRTALCTGVECVVVPKNRSAAPTPAVSKASAGALEHMPVGRVANLVHAMGVIKEKGGWVIGLDAAAEQSVYGTDFSGTIALLIGGEETGLRRLVRRECDFLVRIPMAPGALSSLNAAVAGAVVLYEAFRQRRHAA
jgi:23S rRNA (guanosine2251-2'-O)-methyltransferase